MFIAIKVPLILTPSLVGGTSKGFHFSYPAQFHKIYAVTPVLCLNFRHQYD